jgi:hypothetical protein
VGGRGTPEGQRPLHSKGHCDGGGAQSDADAQCPLGWGMGGDPDALGGANNSNRQSDASRALSYPTADLEKMAPVLTELAPLAA